MVTGRSSTRSQRAEEALTLAGVEFEIVRTPGEPSIEQAREAARQGRALGAEFVVAWGGGSAIDLGKAAAALIPAKGDVLDYLEVIGGAQPLAAPALPSIAIPTTAGTGAEVTKNAVLSSPADAVKVSLRHDSMLPRLAIVDPELTLGCPVDITSATGLDALTQCLEPLVSRLHNPMTDALASEGLRRGARSLARAVERGDDLEARTDMALCSLFGGLALANAKLGAVHGFAAPIGGMFPSPHGAVCARLLPVVCELNVRALESRAPASPLRERYDLVARLLTGRHDATAADGLAFLNELVERLAVPRLSSYGLTKDRFDELAHKASKASSMAGNPLVLEHDELLEILARSA